MPNMHCIIALYTKLDTACDQQLGNGVGQPTAFGW